MPRDSILRCIIADAGQHTPYRSARARRRYGDLGHFLVVTTTIACFNHRVFSSGERHLKRPPQLAGMDDQVAGSPPRLTCVDYRKPGPSVCSGQAPELRPLCAPSRFHRPCTGEASPGQRPGREVRYVPTLLGYRPSRRFIQIQPEKLLLGLLHAEDLIGLYSF